MRRLATTLSALALIWTATVTAFVLAGRGGRIRTGFTLGEVVGEPGVGSVALLSANGVWLVGLLVGIAILSAVPFGVALTHPRGQRTTSWVVGVLLLAFCAFTFPTIGPFYVPGALALIGAGAAGGRAGEVVGRGALSSPPRI